METKKMVKETTKAGNAGFEVLCKRFGKERVEEWQKEYAPRKLNVIEVEGKLAVLRPIRASEVANYSYLYLTEGMDKACSFVMSELWIDGDNEIRDEEEYFISAMLQVESVINLKKSTFYKL